MKLLCFSDIHNNARAIDSLVERSAHVDIVIGAGDFCLTHEGLENTIAQLSAINKPAVFVAGNSETGEELAAACQPWPHFHVLHGNATTIDGVTFYGVGGGIPVTPFGSWSWDFTEQQARALLENCPPHAVLVTHSPPKGCLDITSRGLSVGSEVIREVICAKQPQLEVCGHIHESSGQLSWINSTPVINAGPTGLEYDLIAP